MLTALLEGIASSITRRRTFWCVAVLGLGAALAWGASRITLSLDTADFLAQSHRPDGAEDTERLPEAAGRNYLAIVLEAEEPIAPAEVDSVFRFLTPRLAALDGVGRVQDRLTPAEVSFGDTFYPKHVLLYLSPGALRVASGRLARDSIRAALLDGADRSPFAGGLVPPGRDPLGFIALAAQPLRRWDGVSHVRVVEGFFALPGERTFFITVESTVPIADLDAARTLLRSVDGVLDHAKADSAVGSLLRDKDLFVVGRPVSWQRTYDAFYRDVVRVAVAAAAVVALLLALFFRRPLAPLLLLVPVGLGLLASAASAAMLFPSVSLIAWVFIGLMVGLGVDFGVHIAVHYWAFTPREASPEEALASALIRPGRGIILGGLTSAAAFATLWTLPYPAMPQIAWMTAFGLLAILVASLTVLPLLLSFWRPNRRPGLAWGSRWSRLANRSRSHPWVALAPWCILLVAAAALLPSLRFELHPWKLIVRGNPESARLDSLTQTMGSSFSPILVVSRGGTVDEALARDREAMEILNPIALRAGVATIQSPARWLPDPAQQRANIDWVKAHPALFSADRFRRDYLATVERMEAPDLFLTEVYLPRVVGALDNQLEEISLDDLRDLGLGNDIDRHVMVDGDGATAVSYVFLRRFPWTEGTVARFLSVTRAAGLTDVPGVTLAGSPLRSVETVQLRGAVTRALVLAGLLVGGLLWWRFRRVRLVVLCLVPLVMGLAAGVLVMGLLGMRLDLLTLTIAPILVGIGVDDGIHMVERLSAGRDVDTALRETGASVTMTTLTTVGALACLGLASFTGLRELGLVGAVGLTVCLLASLHLIPLGWQWVDHRGQGDKPAIGR